MGRSASRRDDSPRSRLVRSMPAGTAVRIVLQSLLDEMLAEEPGVREGLDPEHLHRFRVAGRSARSVLRHAGDALPPKRAGKVSTGLAWLASLTGPARDLELQLLQLPDEEDVGPLRDALRRQRDSAFGELLEGLDSPRYATLLRRWSALASEDRVRRSKARRAAGPVVDAYVYTAHRRVLELGTAIHPQSSPEDLHRLRKRAKALRYLLENFRAFYPPGAWKAAVRELKSLQDALGEYQDCQVQAERLRALAIRPEGPGGQAGQRILATLESRRERLGAEIPSRFEHFTAPEMTAAFCRLYAPDGLHHLARAGT